MSNSTRPLYHLRHIELMERTIQLFNIPFNLEPGILVRLGPDANAICLIRVDAYCSAIAVHPALLQRPDDRFVDGNRLALQFRAVQA